MTGQRTCETKAGQLRQMKTGHRVLSTFKKPITITFLPTAHFHMERKSNFSPYFHFSKSLWFP